MEVECDFSYFYFYCTGFVFDKEAFEVFKGVLKVLEEGRGSAWASCGRLRRPACPPDPLFPFDTSKKTFFIKNQK